MSILQIFKETTLPSQLHPHSMYLIAPSAKPDYVEIYITGTQASTVKRLINENDVKTMIDTAIAGIDIDPGFISHLKVVANIAERDALSPIETTMVLVVDASGDETVISGGATYVYNPDTLMWTKIGETESMDLVLSWSNITGRPNSSVADIDDAVQKKHSHSNITELNKIGQDAEGNLTYGENYPHIGFDLVNW